VTGCGSLATATGIMTPAGRGPSVASSLLLCVGPVPGRPPKTVFLFGECFRCDLPGPERRLRGWTHLLH
jgi:hypothetical protein